MPMVFIHFGGGVVGKLYHRVFYNLFYQSIKFECNNFGQHYVLTIEILEGSD